MDSVKIPSVIKPCVLIKPLDPINKRDLIKPSTTFSLLTKY